MAAGRLLSVILSGLLLFRDVPAAANDTQTTSWPGSAIGYEEIILPGFEALRRDGDTVFAFGRAYQWDDSFLPSRIDSRGRRLVEGMRIEVASNGATFVLVPEDTRWTASGPTRQVYEAAGQWRSLRFKIETIVEYDGVADVRLSVQPERPETVDSIRIVADLATTKTTHFLGFPIEGIRRQKQRDDLLTLPYRGRFLAAVVAGDGDRSFWWFADSQQGWRGSPLGGTEIVSDGQTARISQEIVNGPMRIDERLNVRFGLLATPVKAVNPEWRGQRPALGAPSLADSRRGGVFKLWWPTAFAYDAYPYTKYHNEDGAGLTPADRAAYPGLAANRRLIIDTRKSFGIHWIPYFSAHVLSGFDPVLQKQRRLWEVEPPYVFRDGLSPYSNAYEKPTLSHNALGYTDYILERIASVAKDLPIEGIYLDHGPPFDSMPHQLSGLDADRPSLDIFATRLFLKRLSVLFHVRGRAGYSFVHVSNREIVPAYTFAWSLIDGEQYRSDVRDGRYQDLVSLDEFRMRFGTNQYGMRSYWIPEDWWVNRNNKEWAGSEAQRLAYRRTLGLALVHDVGVWAQGSPPGERERLLSIIDRFGIARAAFRGYWHQTDLVDSSGSKAVVSTYRTDGRLLAIVLNVSADPVQVDLKFHPELRACMGTPMAKALSDGFKSGSGRYEATIEAYDFAMATIEVGDDCSAGAGT